LDQRQSGQKTGYTEPDTEGLGSVTNQNYCGGASWSLAPYGQRNCLLASTRDSKERYTDRHREASYTTCLLAFPFSRCHALPIQRPAIWHALVPSTLYRSGLHVSRLVFDRATASEAARGRWKGIALTDEVASSV
jgi:hypothetical protein